VSERAGRERTQPLRAAVGDLYRNSWRFVLANGCLAAALLVPVWVAVRTAVLAPLLLVLLAGPAAAGLVHCAVLVTQGPTGEVRVVDFGRGVRRHWRRGLVLGALVGLVGAAGISAIRFYADRGGVWTVAAFGCGYLLAAALLFQLVLWPVAIHRADRPLVEVARSAGLLFGQRWPAVLRLGAALLAVNLAGAVAVLPLLMFTIALSFLAAARLVLPAEPVRAGPPVGLPSVESGLS
jgi:hypothetical protein